MNRIKLGAFCSFLLLTSFCFSQEKPVKNDSITLTQAYVNLTLTKEYFEKLPKERLEKMLPFLKKEIDSITNPDFIDKNRGVYDFTRGVWFYNKSIFDYKFSDTLDRSTLINLHGSLKKSIELYNGSTDYTRMGFLGNEENVFYDLMNFGFDSYFDQMGYTLELKKKYTRLFNDDIYPDFKQLLLNAKEKSYYGFKQISELTKQYSFAFELHILNNGDQHYFDMVESKIGDISRLYELDAKMHAIAQYIQLRYIVYEENPQQPNGFDIDSLYYNYHEFSNLMEGMEYFEEDPFMKEELNKDVVDELYEKMIERYPHNYLHSKVRLDDLANMPHQPPVKYYFPNPAPMPSARTFISNYKPDLKKLGDVDEYLKPLFYSAGYKDHLHYYYSIDGYAMLSSLEKFNKNGESVDEDKRWISAFDQGKFSYYQIFKSIFFEVETEFRMIAIVVASKNIRISSMPMTAQMAENLMANSYSELPEDLKNLELTPKNMSVLVYHFHQDDIGKVPKLNLDGEYSVKDYLITAKLDALIED